MRGECGQGLTAVEGAGLHAAPAEEDRKEAAEVGSAKILEGTGGEPPKISQFDQRRRRPLRDASHGRKGAGREALVASATAANAEPGSARPLSKAVASPTLADNLIFKLP